FPQAANPAYPDQWYDHPRLNDQPRPGGSRLDGPPAGARRADPRLEGMNYDELRYDEPSPGQPGYDEPLDDESWYEELRRSAPAYPQGFGPQHPSGPHRRVEPQAPGHGQPAGTQPGSPFPTAPAAQGNGFLSAPVASVGLLTPPAGTRVDALR